MIIKAENINELLRLGFQPETLIVQTNGKYYIDEYEFKDFADGEDWEKGLDYSIDANDEISFSIVLTEEGYGEQIEPEAEYDNDDDDDEDEVEDCVSELQQTLKDELDFIKDNSNSLGYCKAQLSLIKTILTR
jgi:hypothetical protein